MKTIQNITVCFLISTCVFGKLKVFDTASMWADMCAVIGSDRIDFDLIVPIG